MKATIRRILCAALPVALVATIAQAEPFVYVFTSEDDQATVAVIDAGLGNVIPGGMIDVGYSSNTRLRFRRLAISPDGTRVYLGGNLGGPSDVSGILAIDTTSNQLVGETIATNGIPQAVAVAPDSAHLYALNGAGRIEIAGVADGEALEQFPTHGSGSLSNVAITPDGTRAYALKGAHGVDVVDTGAGELVGDDPIDVGNIETEAQIAMHPDGTRAYVTAGHGFQTITVIDTATNTVAGEPIEMDEYSPAGIAFTPDGRYAYVSMMGLESDFNNTVRVIDTATDTVIGDPIEVGTAPTGIAVTPDGKRVYVANREDGTVSVIDTADNTVIGAPIDVGTNPWSIVIGHGPDIDHMTADPGNPMRVYAGTGGAGVFRTDDGGETWTETNTGLGGMHITALAVASDSSAVYAGTRADGVYKSTDAGENWNALPGIDPRIRSLQIAPHDDLKIYAGVAEGGVFISTDGGESWEQSNDGLQ